MKRLVVALAFTCLPAASAQTPGRVFAPEIETQARDVGKSLRCVVCQNQSIEESNAPLAADMRNLVRERLAAGQSKEDVMAYMTDRYGNFVRMQPPLQLDTLLLWFGPVLLLIAAAIGWVVYLRPSRKSGLAPTPLSDAEAAEVARRIESGGQA